ncbi:MAG: hypothetical protein QME81_00700 [bacterium]|nr:hypothetical protein [bacterium]
MFAHICAEQNIEGDKLDNKIEKIKRIREIHRADLEVVLVIHRHGMDDETALEVEAALIDAYPGLTNVVGGAGSNDYGVMHVKEIISLYHAEPAVFQQHKALLLNVNRSAAETSLYEATRYAWVINKDKDKAKQAEVILAIQQGRIIGAFIADDWLEATAANFPGRDDIPGRFGFVGQEAPAAISRLYVGKRVPDEYLKPGAANPVRYTWDA